MKKRFLLMGAAVVLLAAAAAGGSLAAGQASGNAPVTAPLQAPNLTIAFNSDNGDTEEVDAVFDGVVMPGDEDVAVTDNYSVKNTGSVDSYIRVTVRKYWADKETGEKLEDLDAGKITLNPNAEGWLEAKSLAALFSDEDSDETQVFYCTSPVDAGTATAGLLESFDIAADLSNAYADKAIVLEAVAEGVQFAGADYNEVNAAGIKASWGVQVELDENGNIASVRQ
ncbi:MAG TPA: hypothetical protein H9840_06400 [Candidatus Anaerofilum excrementigallinarum]|nr:hypothetical protein [Candidatus Anaerofilum excrementigallinarum]